MTKREFQKLSFFSGEKQVSFRGSTYTVRGIDTISGIIEVYLPLTQTVLPIKYKLVQLAKNEKS